MAKIKVTLFNFHSPGCTHIEVGLENTSVEPTTYYKINRWEAPGLDFNPASRFYFDLFEEASSNYSFEINANPESIAKNWNAHYRKTLTQAGIISNNCGDAAQWFLREYAKIPDPSFTRAPVTLNHLSLGIFMPSFIPIGITLPGRVMDNAKFHIEARKNEKQENSLSSLTLQVSIALAAVAVAGSIAGIVAASLFLTGGLSLIIIGACVLSGALSAWGLFKSVNLLSAKNLRDDPKEIEPPRTQGKP